MRALDLIASVGDVWVVWLVGVCVLAVLLRRSLLRLRWQTAKRFLSDERGASYALPFVLTFPVYLLVVSFVVQATMILLVKMGTIYAAHAAARAAVVWRTADVNSDQQGEKLAKQRAQQAAVAAMAPFASGYDKHLSLASLKHSKAAAQYVAAYVALARQSEAGKHLAEVKFVARKYLLAAHKTKVTIERLDTRPKFNQDVTVNVEFTMPMHLPGAGRVMGKWSLLERRYDRKIVSQVTLPVEAAESKHQRLGIPYDSSQLQ